VEEKIILEAGVPVSRVRIEAGILDSERAPSLLLPERPGRAGVAFVTHAGAVERAATLARAVAATGLRTAVHVIEDREAGKTIASAEAAYLWLNDIGVTRGDTIVGVGGGTVTDLAGFVAATYLRGLEVVLVPTTLLGAVDAAIGGKTGVNVGGKNIVGAFRHPAVVLVDPAVLEGLPKPLLVEGAAEAVKAGLIGDPVLVALYEREGLSAPIAQVVSRAVDVKARIVSGDFTEQGERMHLNYGHTVGHAVETAAGIPHGHAVAVGMVVAGAISESHAGFAERARQDRLIESLGLPIRITGVRPGDVMRLVDLDKKRDDRGIRMVLLEAIGRPVVAPVERATVEAALTVVGID
jgi:3-dehydroquinate synthetase